MQVLIKNPYSSSFPLKGVIPSFWSDDCLYPDKDFDLNLLIKASDPLGLSPYFFLEPKVALALSLLEKKGPVYVKGAGVLGAVAVMMTVGPEITHEEDSQKFNQYAEEYLPFKTEKVTGSYEQVLTFDSPTIDPVLWDKLKVGGFYILVGSKGFLKSEATGKFEAWGRIWPLGMPTEFGWAFNNEETGLKNLEVIKLKKLS